MVLSLGILTLVARGPVTSDPVTKDSLTTQHPLFHDDNRKRLTDETERLLTGFAPVRRTGVVKDRESRRKRVDILPHLMY